MQKQQTLTNEQLHRTWDKYVKTPIPRLRKSLLIKYARWHQQAHEDKINLKHFFKQLAQAQESLSGPREKRFAAGSYFIRSYQGIQYKVEVASNGYLYNGRTYKSLSAIAREITGKQWNGKVFFGVKNDK